MRDHDVDLEGLASSRHHDRREDHDAQAGAHGAGEVGKAIEAKRPDALGAKGMLHLQRAAGNAGIGSLMAQRKDDEESPVKDVVRSSGAPLDKETRQEMEGRFDTDFSDVQVHTDGKAADSAKAVSAQAYTVGSHVVFNEGRYQPDTPDGKHTIAHELTHVVQQRNGPVDGTSVGGGVKLSDPGDRFEREADTNARTLLSSPAPTQAPGGGSGGSVQRAEEEEEPAQAMALQRQEEEEEPAQAMALQREETKEEEPANEEPAKEEPGKEVAEEKPAEEEKKDEEPAQAMALQREEEEAPEEGEA